MYDTGPRSNFLFLKTLQESKINQRKDLPLHRLAQDIGIIYSIPIYLLFLSQNLLSMRILTMVHLHDLANLEHPGIKVSKIYKRKGWCYRMWLHRHKVLHLQRTGMLHPVYLGV